MHCGFGYAKSACNPWHAVPAPEPLPQHVTIVPHPPQHGSQCAGGAPPVLEPLLPPPPDGPPRQPVTFPLLSVNRMKQWVATIATGLQQTSILHSPAGGGGGDGGFGPGVGLGGDGDGDGKEPEDGGKELIATAVSPCTST